MIQGDPPFGGTSEMEVYGGDAHAVPVLASLYGSIDRSHHKVAHPRTENRLGNLRHGVDDVMSHPWFYDQSWDGLLDAPPVTYVCQRPSRLRRTVTRAHWI